MNVALRQLRAFLAVARHGSFSRAALEVGLSQSAVSLSVRQLEAELGLKLLDRTTRQVQLTAVGATLVASGSRLVDELDVTLMELRDIGVQHRGRVKMACVPAVARSLMPGCVAYCSEKWPNISFGIDDCAATEVVRKASRGEDSSDPGLKQRSDSNGCRRVEGGTGQGRHAGYAGEELLGR